MKILQICSYYAPSVGGIEQTAHDIAQALQGRYEQKVFCFNHEKGSRVDCVDGVEVIRVACFAKVASQSLSFSYGHTLKKVFAEFRPDVVIFHYPNPFAAYHLKKQLKSYPGCKLIVWWHLDITRQKILGKLFTWQSKWLLRRAARAVATSPNYIEGSPLLQSAREKCTVIASCVNGGRLVPSAVAREEAEALRRVYAGKTICFAVGRHVPYKGMEYLIRAGKLLDDTYAIWIGGQGPLTKSLKALAANDPKVEFLGKLSDDVLQSRLLACDIFCFPSITRNEAFGLALAEAMYFSKPAVTFTIPHSGVNYVSLNDVTGIEAENRNIAAYAEAIKKLAADETLRKQYGEAGRRRVLENFTFDRFQAKLIQLLQEMIS